MTEILELNKRLDKIPEVIRVKDGDEIVNCRLCMFYNKSYKGERKWTVGYYSTENDYFLSCGYGSTITEAVEHLKRTIKNIRLKGDAEQYDYII